MEEITVTWHKNPKVIVENQYIPTLCCAIFNLKSDIKSISFDNCLIEDIQEECFSEKVANVTTNIEIFNNKLTSIKKDTFRNLKVQDIYLKNNLIEVIEDDSFLNLTELIYLDLSFNKVRTLKIRSLDEYTKLWSFNFAI
ncbi:hypothetical protein Zmor_022497 [Zophobas morio]|uniref:Uncharacterized protein n=1 Tax=Zophobas morio TaxID=2755281 RepID=A0AA38HWQ2_9CUCU|nr:hypothetical protein Zmor_022497 [Zophobas morio]